MTSTKKVRGGISICFYLSGLLMGGILTGCKTLAGTYHRIEARMAYDAADQETNNYGAFFVWSLPAGRRGTSDGVRGSEYTER